MIIEWKNQILKQIWKVECLGQLQVDIVVENQIQGYQQGVSIGLTILEDLSNLRNHQFGIVNCLFRELQGWWEVLWSNKLPSWEGFPTLPG